MQTSVKQELLNQANALSKKIGYYKSEITAIKTVQDALRKKAELEKLKEDSLKMTNGKQDQLAIEQFKAAQRDLGELSGITDQLEELDKLSDLTQASLNETERLLKQCLILLIKPQSLPKFNLCCRPI